MAHQYNPITLFFKGFDWSGRTSRGQLLLVLIAVWLPGVALVFLDLFEGWERLAEVLCWVVLAILTVPLFGHIVRRLNDVDWPAGLVLLLLIPGVSLALQVVLLIKGRAYGRLYDITPLRMAGFVMSFFVAALVLSRVLWSPFIPVSGSMKPGLLPGDVVIVERLGMTPSVGDVIALEHPLTGEPYMKRIVAQEGDTVRMVNGTLVVNGQPATVVQIADWTEAMTPQGPNRFLPRCANGAVGQGANCHKRQFQETLIDAGPWPILDIRPNTPLDNTREWQVPEGHFFVLGDNRDNSLDSRVAAAAGGVGMVPQSAVIGRALRVLYSYDGAAAWQLWNWRTDRILRAIE